ncbi:hypothetical protein BGZ89_002114 [Linnemannia elongata]|nr:hypothetical protein BGZ89_002114 [Linnemannia elongata]
MSYTPPNTQGIRSININNFTSSPPHPTEVVYVDIYTNRITREKFILWEDVRLAFHNAFHVRHQARVIPFMKDGDFNTLRPLRIAVIPGEILDVIVGNPQDNTPKQHPSVLRQIEQQAAWLPRHNALSTMRPTGNNFARAQNTKQQLDDAAVRARNINLARKYAKEAMTKIADTMDLDALHTKGDAAPADFCKALECYLKAVHQSHAHAQVQVGDLFFEGKDVSKDSFVVMGWYHKAAFQGDTNAQRKIEAHRLFERQNTKASETPTSSIPKTQHISSKMSVPQPSSDDNELQTPKEIPLLANETSTLADISVPTNPVVSRKDIDAQIVLGDSCLDSQDYQAAMEHYLKVANQGHPIGQWRVGYLYNEGLGVSQSYSTAMDWFFKAASQGDPNAQYSIGVMYDKGQGVPQDFSNAMEWFRKAVDQGDAYAQNNVGLMYDEGNGVPQDFAKAMEWFRMAADQGDPAAQYNIGIMYKNGQGVTKSDTEARK